MDDVDCQVFRDQLEVLVAGRLPPDAVVQLRAHAAECADCELQLKVYRHLAEPSLEELESAVPQRLLASMWPGIQERISVQDRPPAKFAGRKRGWDWLLPTLAAASLALLTASGYLLVQLRQAEARMDLLAESLEMATTPSGFYTQAGTRLDEQPPLLQGRNPWLRALRAQDEISLGGLKQFLQELPGNPTLLDSNQLRNLQRIQPPWAPAGLRFVLGELTGMDALRAQDLIRILSAPNLDPGLSVPTARLIELFS
jgi:hypothetical protein